MSKNSFIDAGDLSGRVAALQSFRPTKQAVANAAGVTLTAANLLGGKILRSGAAAVSDTTPTAAQIIAALPFPAVGDCFDFEIRNSNSGTLTLVAGTGVTLEGTTTIATVFNRRYLAEVTSLTAVTIHGMSTAAV